MSFLRFTGLKVGSAVFGVGGSAAAYQIQTDEGTRRSITFWKQIFPIYLHYRTYQVLNRDLNILSKEYAEAQYERLNEEYTEQVKNIVYTMRGFYLKQAQIMSTQDDFVPSAYMRWVKDTQDKVPSEYPGIKARNYVREVLMQEQGLDFDEVFSDWQDDAIGVASIGQVHKAVLRATGEVVAVKFLVPGIEAKFRSDIRTLKSFCKLAMPQHVSAFDEIEKQFCTEFDYIEEGKNLQIIHDLITPKWKHAVVIPRPKMQYCSKTVLVMDYLEGLKLVDGIKEQYKLLAEKTNRSFDEMVKEQKDQLVKGTFKFKSLEDSRVESERLKWYLFLQDCVNPVNINRFLWNNTIGLVYGAANYQRSSAPPDLGHTLEILAHVHADQIFEHGIFNGDPHPGNILLLKDGRLGLIDYGQIKRMTLPQRLTYAKLILAHTTKHKEEVVRIHFHEMGTITKKMRADIAYLSSSFYHDRDTPDVCRGYNIATFVDWLQAQDPMVKLAEEYLLAARVSIMMRGMAKAFGLQIRMSKLWESEASSLLNKHGVNYNEYKNVNVISGDVENS